MKNKIKRTSFIGGLIATLALGLTSCDLNDTQQVTNISNVLRVGTQLAVSRVVADNPDTEQHFKAVSLALKAAVAGDALTPQEVTDVINGYLNNTDANKALVQSGITLALGTYQTFYSQNLGPEVKPHLRKLLTAIEEGVRLGLLPTTSGLSLGQTNTNPIELLTEADLQL